MIILGMITLGLILWLVSGERTEYRMSEECFLSLSRQDKAEALDRGWYEISV